MYVKLYSAFYFLDIDHSSQLTSKSSKVGYNINLLSSLVSLANVICVCIDLYIFHEAKSREKVAVKREYTILKKTLFVGVADFLDVKQIRVRRLLI